MKNKSKTAIKFVIFVIWMIVCYYFDTLHFRKESFFSSWFLPIGFIAIIVYDRFLIWWIKLFHISRRAYHERGNFTINDTEPLTYIPAQKNPKTGSLIHKKYSAYPIDGMNIPSQWISKPGGGEDGYYIGPTEYIRKNGAELDLGVADVDVYTTADEKDKIPDDIIPQLKQACLEKGYVWNDDVPIYFGEVPSLRVEKNYLENILGSKEIQGLPSDVKNAINQMAKENDALGIIKNRLEWAMQDSKDAWRNANKWKQEAGSKSQVNLGSLNNFNQSGLDGPEGK